MNPDFITIEIPLFSMADFEKIKQHYSNAHRIDLNYHTMIATVVLKKNLHFLKKTLQ